MALPGFTLRTAEDEHDRKLLIDVERFGWHVVHVNEDAKGPGFSFTVGFYYTFQQPEILVMGLKQETAQKILNIAAVLMAGGKVFVPFKPMPDFAESYNSVFAPIEIENYQNYLGYAIWFYRSLPAPFPAMQLVWPDKQGKFPWEPGYDARYLDLQKALYAMPPSDPPCAG